MTTQRLKFWLPVAELRRIREESLAKLAAIKSVYAGLHGDEADVAEDRANLAYEYRCQRAVVRECEMRMAIIELEGRTDGR